MKKPLYTTSEYIDALKLRSDGNLYECKGKEFGLFSNVAAANYDADWFVNYYKERGLKWRRPKVYRIRLEKVKR